MSPITCGVDDSGTAREAARVARGLSSELGLDRVFAGGTPGGWSEPTGERREHLRGGPAEAAGAPARPGLGA